MTGLSPSAIRYYDKEGLLPQVERKNGIRMFSDMDIRWLHLLTCLENTGMPIKRIREYAEMAQQGDETLKERQLLIQEQRQFVQDQMDQLMYYMQELDFCTCQQKLDTKLKKSGIKNESLYKIHQLFWHPSSLLDKPCHR